jgi:hypothetical protein
MVIMSDSCFNLDPGKYYGNREQQYLPEKVLFDSY